MRKREFKRCDLGCDHVVRGGVHCDYCGGLIVELEGTVADVFGQGPSLFRLHPLITTETRKLVVIRYMPVIPGTPPVEMEFCSFSHALARLRKTEAWQQANDQITILGPLQAFAQTPIREPGEPTARPG